jgi:hypothetical protein
VAVQFDATYPSLTVSMVFPAPVGTVDITSYVLDTYTFNGRVRQADRFDGRGTLMLDNWDGRFTQANTGGPYASGGVSFVRPRVGITIEAVWNSVTYELFTGEVSSWKDDWKGNASVEGQDSITAVSFIGNYSRIAAWIGQAVTPVGGGEQSGARISRILTAAGWSGSTSIATGNVPLAETDLSGNGIQQILDVVDTEGGAFYIEGDGGAVFEDRSSLVLNSRSNTSQVTFSDASVFMRDVQLPTIDDSLIYNAVTFQRDGGARQSASDATSQSLYGVRTYERTGLPALEDVWMQSAAEWNVARWKDPEYRIESVTIDPNVSGTLMWPHALGRRLHDRATITAYNARSAQTVTMQVFIEGVSHTISHNRWATTFFFSSAAAWAGFSASVWDTGVWDTARWFY